ncbi:MAG: 23S rRNA (pseudouridine(1915)-N(3))-methyltransferase RlmH, partial [Bacilli bacterium]|nr:23S rRNA (pseudouridine(1915)-N(3))-methyltransferase RlmH [Bacilli bacterium]
MIKIICVGKIKEPYLKELIADYQKRISKYHKLEIIEVKDEDSLEKEKNNILKVLDPKDYIITLEIEGK